MAHSKMCLGHEERACRRNIIAQLITKSASAPDENCRISIKRGPVNVETSLKELEEDYESKPEWKLIKEGGVLSVPVEELRLENLPNRDKRRARGKHNEVVGQTIKNLNEEIRDKYEAEKQKAKATGKSKSEAEKKGFAASTKLPQLQAVKAWLAGYKRRDKKGKKALEKMIRSMMI